MTANLRRPAKLPSFLASPMKGESLTRSGALARSCFLFPEWATSEAHTALWHPAWNRRATESHRADLRGHGDSDVTFSSYGDEETADDIVALIEELDGPAVVVGNSMGAAAATLAAAKRPELVLGLVLVGPFLRDPTASGLQRLLLRAAMARPFAAMSWKAYLPKLYAGWRPADFDQYRASVIESIRKPGYSRAFSLTTRTSHASVEARLVDVVAPALVLMGEKDPDFADPRAESSWIAERLGAEVVMVPEAGHYPQSQRPDVTTEAILTFLKRVSTRA